MESFFFAFFANEDFFEPMKKKIAGKHAKIFSTTKQLFSTTELLQKIFLTSAIIGIITRFVSFYIYIFVVSNFLFSTTK